MIFQDISGQRWPKIKKMTLLIATLIALPIAVILFFIMTLNPNWSEFGFIQGKTLDKIISIQKLNQKLKFNLPIKTTADTSPNKAKNLISTPSINPSNANTTKTNSRTSSANVPKVQTSSPTNLQNLAPGQSDFGRSHIPDTKSHNKNL